VCTIKLGKLLEANYLDIAPEARSWAVNQAFLDAAIARGDQFILATAASAARAGNTFAKELEYLASRGITF